MNEMVEDDNVRTSMKKAKDRPDECDYDVNPSKLYSLIQSKNWDDALHRIKVAPHEAHTWVYRTEKDNKLRWRLLPLHAAIIFKAPETIVESLLLKHPLGACCKDDQGMLPIHLALRNKSSDVIVALLLVSYPKSAEVKDRKGRLPFHLAQCCDEPSLKEAYIGVLKRVPAYFNVAEISISKAGLLAMPDVVCKRQAEAENLNLMSKIDALENELTKVKENSSVVVEHANSLEAQLKTRADAERFLATKIANLDTKLKDKGTAKEVGEAELKAEIDRSNMEKIEAERRCKALEERNRQLERTIDKQEEILNVKISKKDRVKQLETENAEAVARVAVIEAQLKKKIHTEQHLASQVRDLANQLADRAEATGNATKTYTDRIDKLEDEKKGLQNSLTELNIKLKSVLDLLDKMSAEQLAIVNFTVKHQSMVMEAEAQKERIMADSEQQENIVMEAAKERELIVNILTRQAKEIERTSEERESLMQACEDQQKRVAVVSDERKVLMESIKIQQNNMDAMRRKVSSIYEENNWIDSDSEDESNYQSQRQIISTSASSPKQEMEINIEKESGLKPISVDDAEYYNDSKVALVSPNNETPSITTNVETLANEDDTKVLTGNVLSTKSNHLSTRDETDDFISSRQNDYKFSSTGNDVASSVSNLMAVNPNHGVAPLMVSVGSSFTPGDDKNNCAESDLDLQSSLDDCDDDDNSVENLLKRAERLVSLTDSHGNLDRPSDEE